MIYYLLQLLKLKSSHSSPRKWTRKDIPVAQQQKVEFENTQTSIDVDLAPHKLFELFLFEPSLRTIKDIYANSKTSFTFHATTDKFHAFLTIMLISG